MQIPALLLLLPAPIIGFQLYTWIRIRANLGKFNCRASTLSNNLGLAISALSVIILIWICISSASWLLGESLPDWASESLRRNLLLNMLGALFAIATFIFSLWEGQIREHGIYAGGLYTWEQLTGYQAKGNSIRVWTNKQAKYTGKYKIIKWEFIERSQANRVQLILKSKGVSEIKDEE